KKVYEKEKIDISTPAKRIAHVVQSCFNGKRIVVFSGGEAKDLDGVYNEARAIRDGGGHRSVPRRHGSSLRGRSPRSTKPRPIPPTSPASTSASRTSTATPTVAPPMCCARS